jgi:hypothetical protein
MNGIDDIGPNPDRSIHDGWNEVSPDDYLDGYDRKR